MGGERVDRFEARFELVLLALRPERAHATAQCLGDLREQRIELVRLAPQADQQHSTGIGMAGQSGEQLLRPFQILAELRAAVRMAERIDAVDGAGVAEMGDPRDPLGGAGDAADRRQDPDLVARSHPPVGAAIAVEPGRLVARKRRDRRGLERITLDALQLRLEIVAVDMLARSDRRGQPPDRPAIFAQPRPRCEVADRELVSGRDASLAIQRHRDVVVGMEPQQSGRVGRGRGGSGLSHGETGVRLKRLAYAGKAA